MDVKGAPVTRSQVHVRKKFGQELRPLLGPPPTSKGALSSNESGIVAEPLIDAMGGINPGMQSQGSGKGSYALVIQELAKDPLKHV